MIAPGLCCEAVSNKFDLQHNPFHLPLSVRCISLKRKRPLFLCERLLLESDAAADKQESDESEIDGNKKNFRRMFAGFGGFGHSQATDHVDPSLSRHRESSVRPRFHRKRSAAALLGSFRNFEEGGMDTNQTATTDNSDEDKVEEMTVDMVVASAIEERKWSDRVRNLFEAFDLDNDGLLREEEYILGWKRLHTGAMSVDELRSQFRVADEDGSGSLNYAEFHKLLMNNTNLSTSIVKSPPSHRDERGLIQIEPSREKYFGELLRKYNSANGKSSKTLDFALGRSQEQAMQLYESRIGSLQRYVSMVVMFHQMGRRVERFFERISFGLLGYRMDRTHSIMRIATTATPVSGADVRRQMHQLRLLKRVKLSVRVISRAWLRYKERKNVHAMAHKISFSHQLITGEPKEMRRGDCDDNYEMNGYGNDEDLEPLEHELHGQHERDQFQGRTFGDAYDDRNANKRHEYAQLLENGYLA